jgi:hypothetical protein
MLIYSRRKDLPYKTLFQFREGKDDPKKENMGPNSETSQRGPTNVYKDREKLASQKGISSEDAIRIHIRNRRRRSGISGEEPGQTCLTPNRKQR